MLIAYIEKEGSGSAMKLTFSGWRGKPQHSWIQSGPAAVPTKHEFNIFRADKGMRIVPSKYS